MRKVLGMTAIVVGIIGVSYIIITLIANFSTFKAQDNGPKLPAVSEARTALTIESNGVSYLTNDYEKMGTKVGTRVFAMKSYWELSGNGYKFRNRELVLDEKIYGPITEIKRKLPTPTTKGG